MSDTTSSWIPDAKTAEQLKRVVSRVYDLPSFPLVIRKLIDVAEDPRSSSKDLAKVMETDQGLSTKILKLVNSAFYAFPRPIASLQHAITLVGYNSVRSLAMSVSVKHIFKETTDGFSQEHFWEHSLATALAARDLAAMNCAALKDDLFTAGLLHDVGVLLEARYFPEELGRAIQTVRTEKTPLYEAEEKELGVNHGLLGAWLAEKWHLPPGIRESMLRHHDFEDPEHMVLESASDDEDEYQEDLNLVIEIVSFANLIARAMGYTNIRTPRDKPGTFDASTEFPEHMLKYLRNNPMHKFCAQVGEEFQASKEFLEM